MPCLLRFTEFRFAEYCPCNWALAGALILLVIQLVFELQADETTNFISAEYTIDRAKPEIRQWNYGSNQTQRFTHDLNASGNFAAAHPGQFNGNREKLTLDMVIFSLLAYLGVEQFDWQMKRTQFVGRSTGTLTRALPGSKPDECTMITKDQFPGILLHAGKFICGRGHVLWSSIPVSSASVETSSKG